MLNPLETVNIKDATLNNNNINNLQQKTSTTNNVEDKKLMKAAQEFEALFVSKLLSTMDSTISREGGMFSEGKGMDTFKSFFFQEIASEVSKNPATSIGIAKQIYEQVQGQVKGGVKNGRSS